MDFNTRELLTDRGDENLTLATRLEESGWDTLDVSRYVTLVHLQRTLSLSTIEEEELVSLRNKYNTDSNQPTK